MKEDRDTARPTRSGHQGCELERETIAKCAFLIWEEEGRPDGKHEDHWRQAELHLRELHPDWIDS